MKLLKPLLLFIFCAATGALDLGASDPANGTPKKVFILPIREDIMPPLVYLVRRGVKEAMESGAEVLVLDMETNGGRVDTTEEIIQILGRFKGTTVTYVNRKAFSAGAFIAVATQKIYMAPQSVIGAAAPLLMSPGGGGGMEIPETLEAKMTSGIRALVRTSAEKNGHNVEVVEAMIDKTKELVVEGEVLNEKGQILTLTNRQAEKEYGTPPKPLLSAGTVESLEALTKLLGYTSGDTGQIIPTGVERLATWINTISPLLLIIGVLGIYIEFKTPGFGLPGIVGIVAFVIYFFGSYIAGLSGIEWVALFGLGLLLFGLELFVFPGTLILGFSGAFLMLLAILMAMVDIYPGTPSLPGTFQIRVPLREIVFDLSVALVGSGLAIWALSFWLPRSSTYHLMVSPAASGEKSLAAQEQSQAKLLGQIGVTLSPLRPGGKAQFGSTILDVLCQGEMVPRGAKVKIVGFAASEAVVEVVA